MCLSHIKIQIWINTIKMATTFSLCFAFLCLFDPSYKSNFQTGCDEKRNLSTFLFPLERLFKFSPFALYSPPSLSLKITLRDSRNKTTSKSWKINDKQFSSQIYFCLVSLMDKMMTSHSISWWPLVIYLKFHNDETFNIEINITEWEQTSASIIKVSSVLWKSIYCSWNSKVTTLEYFLNSFIKAENIQNRKLNRTVSTHFQKQ